MQFIWTFYKIFDILDAIISLRLAVGSICPSFVEFACGRDVKIKH